MPDTVYWYFFVSYCSKTDQLLARKEKKLLSFFFISVRSQSTKEVWLEKVVSDFHRGVYIKTVVKQSSMADIDGCCEKDWEILCYIKERKNLCHMCIIPLLIVASSLHTATVIPTEISRLMQHFYCFVSFSPQRFMGNIFVPWGIYYLGGSEGKKKTHSAFST